MYIPMSRFSVLSMFFNWLCFWIINNFFLVSGEQATVTSPLSVVVFIPSSFLMSMSIILFLLLKVIYKCFVVSKVLYIRTRCLKV